MATSDDDGLSLPSRYREVSLEALNVSVRRRLSKLLNNERLPNEDGIMGDIDELAEMIGFSFIEIQNFGRQNIRDPTSEVLSEWTQRPDLNPTVDNLFRYLLKMGRVDIVSDCRNRILKDIEVYMRAQERKQDEVVPLQDNTVTQSEEVYGDGTDHHFDEYRCMTVQDVKNNTQTFYDAFVCYNPKDSDLKFVKKMLSELESPKYGLKLFVPERDDLPGSSTHSVSAKLIQDRCRRMVIIMSPNFLESAACDFQTKYAQCLSPGSRSKKLVPVLITPCPIPQILRHVTLCDFTRGDLMEWPWNRLACAIKATLNFEELQFNDKIKIDDIIPNVQGGNVYHNSGDSSSSQPLPIIPSPSQPKGGSCHNSPVSSHGNSPMDHSGSYPDLSSMSSIQSMSSMHSVSSNQISQAPPRRKTIPKLFPSSQC